MDLQPVLYLHCVKPKHPDFHIPMVCHFEERREFFCGVGELDFHINKCTDVGWLIRTQIDFCKFQNKSRNCFLHGNCRISTALSERKIARKPRSCTDSLLANRGTGLWFLCQQIKFCKCTATAKAALALPCIYIYIWTLLR